MEKTDAQKTRLGLFVIIGSILFFSGIYFVGIKCFAAKKIEINDFIKIAAKKISRKHECYFKIRFVVKFGYNTIIHNTQCISRIIFFL